MDPLSPLNHFSLSTPIPEAYIVPDFVSLSEEAYLLERVELLGSVEVPNEKSDGSGRSFQSKGSPAGWRTVKGRRSMYWGGSLLSYGKSSVLIPSLLPDFLSWTALQRFGSLGVFSAAKGKHPNHVLVNEYLPGQGIMPHEDGPAYVPIVATLSLGSHTILDLYEYAPSTAPRDSEGPNAGRAINSSPKFSIFIPPRSLFVLTSDLYCRCLHGIAERSVDSEDQLNACINSPPPAFYMSDNPEGPKPGHRERRGSLTFRWVEKVRRVL